MSKHALTSGQVARILNIPSRTVRSYLATGRLRAEQNPITGRWRVGREDLSEFMRNNGLDPDRLARPLRVMVIDRDDSTANLVRKALNGSGRAAIVEREADCASALIRMGDCPPDLVIVDELTAGHHCELLVEAVRGSARTRNVRVLALCAPDSLRLDRPAVHWRLDKPLAVGPLAGALKRTLTNRLSATTSL